MLCKISLAASSFFSLFIDHLPVFLLPLFRVSYKLKHYHYTASATLCDDGIWGCIFHFFKRALSRSLYMATNYKHYQYKLTCKPSGRWKQTDKMHLTNCKLLFFFFLWERKLPLWTACHVELRGMGWGRWGTNFGTRCSPRFLFCSVCLSLFCCIVFASIRA